MDDEQTPAGPETQLRVDPRRALPSVDRLLTSPSMQSLIADYGRPLVTDEARAVLTAARGRFEAGEGLPDATGLTADVERRLARLVRGSLFPVINATGVIVHTNLGRAPLSPAARQAMNRIADGYSNLEYDLEAGARGSRYLHVETLLCRLTGAQAGLVVNNNAGALLLVLAALAKGREVIVSRGQLVEIGGGFRIPDVMRQSGARLVEVGATNRTLKRDFQEALSHKTALLLRVHSSNFKQIGFTAEVTLEELVALGREAGVPVLDDLGSGSLLDTTRYGLAPEPMVQQSVALGADLTTFSGDKLLGGPQAGLIVGSEAAVARLRLHPLVRALRVDKGTLAALQATLLHYIRSEAEQAIPVWRMIAYSLEALSARAADWAAAARSHGIPTAVVAAASTVGGGSLPGETLPTRALAVAHPSPDALAAALRAGDPPVIARISEGQLILDPRTVPAEEDGLLLRALVDAWSKTT